MPSKTTPPQPKAPSPKPLDKPLRVTRKSTLSRRHLAVLVAAQLGVSVNKGRQIVDAVVDVIKQKVVEGHKVEIRGFVTLTTKLAKTRERTNMAKVRAEQYLKGDGEGMADKVVVPAHIVVVAKASSAFMEAEERAGRGAGKAKTGRGSVGLVDGFKKAAS